MASRRSRAFATWGEAAWDGLLLCRATKHSETILQVLVRPDVILSSRLSAEIDCFGGTGAWRAITKLCVACSRTVFRYYFVRRVLLELIRCDYTWFCRDVLLNKVLLLYCRLIIWMGKVQICIDDDLFGRIFCSVLVVLFWSYSDVLLLLLIRLLLRRRSFFIQ